jgi:hypothetical protein
MVSDSLVRLRSVQELELREDQQREGRRMRS